MMEFYPVHDHDGGHGGPGGHEPDSWEDERPPTYNPEDYSAHLSRYHILNKNYLVVSNAEFARSRHT